MQDFHLGRGKQQTANHQDNILNKSSKGKFSDNKLLYISSHEEERTSFKNNFKYSTGSFIFAYDSSKIKFKEIKMKYHNYNGSYLILYKQNNKFCIDLIHAIKKKSGSYKKLLPYKIGYPTARFNKTRINLFKVDEVLFSKMNWKSINYSQYFNLLFRLLLDKGEKMEIPSLKSKKVDEIENYLNQSIVFSNTINKLIIKLEILFPYEIIPEIISFI